MGAFLVSLHVRTVDAGGVDAVLSGLPEESRRTEPDGGWISVYEDRASTQDTDWIADLTAQLSRSAGAPAIAFLVHDSDLAHVWLAQEGELVAHVDSWPGFPDAEPVPTISGADELSALGEHLDADCLTELFGRDVVFAEDLIAELAGHLGINPDHIDDYEDATASPEGIPATGMLDVASQLQQVLPAATPAPPDHGTLVEAAHLGDVATIARLLDHGVPADAQAPWRPAAARSGPGAGVVPTLSATPLFAAASENRAEAVELLLQRGADPNGRIPQGADALSAAATAGHLETVEVLLAGGADPRSRAGGPSAVDALAATRQQLEALRPMLELPMMQDAGLQVPDDTALEACAAALERAAAD